MRACVALLSVCAAALATPAADARPLSRVIISELNDERAKRGLARLTPSIRLRRAAAAHSSDMARRGFFGHNSSDGKSFGERIRRYARWGTKGETLAYTDKIQRRKAQLIVRMWMNSPPHRRTILRPSFRRVGVSARNGKFRGGALTYVTANYATRR